jgi:hypothetical protein
MVLLDAVERRIPAADLSAFHVQQLQNEGRGRGGRLEKVLGKFRPTSADPRPDREVQATPRLRCWRGRTARAARYLINVLRATLFDAGGKRRVPS